MARKPAASACCTVLQEIIFQPLPEQFALKAQEVHVFFADQQDFNLTQLNDFYSGLSNDEKMQADAFKLKLNRDQYILSHYFLRSLIGKIMHVDPSKLIIQQHENKKPFVSYPVFFNLSHSGNKIMIGLQSTGEIGVDLEKVDYRFDYATFAAAHFSPDENRLLEKDAVLNFYDIWTRKEAWLKLTGEGVNDDLLLFDTGNTAADQDCSISIYSFRLDDYAASIALAEPSKKINFYFLQELC